MCVNFRKLTAPTESNAGDRVGAGVFPDDNILWELLFL